MASLLIFCLLVWLFAFDFIFCYTFGKHLITRCENWISKFDMFGATALANCLVSANMSHGGLWRVGVVASEWAVVVVSVHGLVFFEFDIIGAVIHVFSVARARRHGGIYLQCGIKHVGLTGRRRRTKSPPQPKQPWPTLRSLTRAPTRIVLTHQQIACIIHRAKWSQYTLFVWHTCSAASRVPRISQQKSGARKLRRVVMNDERLRHDSGDTAAQFGSQRRIVIHINGTTQARHHKFQAAQATRRPSRFASRTYTKTRSNIVRH